jgi:hypothetical protein
MGNLRNISALALAGLLAAGCVSHQTAKLDAAHALADSSSLANAPAARTAGVASATAGDNWTAANLFEQARAGNNSPLNRFNLASSYEATGRSAQAAVLYRSVVPDGHYLKVTTNRMNDNQKGISRRVNLSEESLRRALVIEAQLRKGGPAAVDLGAPVSESATVGGPKRGVVSDARALNLDEKAEVKQDAKEDAARPQ